jgi:hypothetical protein
VAHGAKDAVDDWRTMTQKRLSQLVILKPFFQRSDTTLFFDGVETALAD